MRLQLACAPLAGVSQEVVGLNGGIAYRTSKWRLSHPVEVIPALLRGREARVAH
jgi:hypothetical protein